jgi:hypothetical protein
MHQYLLQCGRRENSLWLGWLEYDDFPGMLFTPPDIKVLAGRELDPSDVLGCPHNTLLRHAIEGSAIDIPSSAAPS